MMVSNAGDGSSAVSAAEGTIEAAKETLNEVKATEAKG